MVETSSSNMPVELFKSDPSFAKDVDDKSEENDDKDPHQKNCGRSILTISAGRINDASIIKMKDQ